MSFDANMRHVAAGRTIFCKLHTCCKGTRLYDAGLRCGDVVLCHMRDDCTDNPRVVFHTPKGLVETDDEQDFYNVFAVYEGCPDGTGFIDEASRTFALDYMEKFGYVR